MYNLDKPSRKTEHLITIRRGGCSITVFGAYDEGMAPTWTYHRPEDYDPGEPDTFDVEYAVYCDGVLVELTDDEEREIRYLAAGGVGRISKSEYEYGY
jgi:hypothetical protein